MPPRTDKPMTDERYMDSPVKLARRTGILYLLVILAGIASETLVGNSLFVPGDSSATVNNILTHEFAFRAGFVISLVRFALFIALVLALYKLFRVVDGDWSMAMAVFALVSISIGMVSLLFEFAAPLLLSSGDYSSIFPVEQWHAQVQFFIDMQIMGDKASQVLAVWLLPLAYLIYKSGFFPKILAVLMMVAGLGYVIDFLVFILLPSLNWQVAGFAFLGELPFPLWLLIKGVKTK
jgi:hypothetical protein